MWYPSEGYMSQKTENAVVLTILQYIQKFHSELHGSGQEDTEQETDVVSS